MSSEQRQFTIALVGRPNVGKSTLFNRLIGGRRALVASTPGVTRDRREGEADLGGRKIKIVDTGGMSFEKDALFSSEIADQVRQGVSESDLVWLVMDGAEGMNPYDQELFRWLLHLEKPILAIPNKVDNRARRGEISDFFELGAEDVAPVSAMHGVGIDDALTKSLEICGRTEEPETAEIAEAPGAESDPESGPIRIAFLGRPNVGKSSLVNRILGDSRMIVSDLAGTTREAIELPFQRDGGQYALIDTAGIRRKSRTREHLDKVSALNAINALRRTDVAVLVLDSTEPVAEQDAKIAGYILEQKTAIIMVMNKWDQVKSKAVGKELELDVRDKLRFLPYASIVHCSAVRGTGVGNLFKKIDEAYGEYTRRVQTADLNRVVQMSVLRQPPPNKGRNPTKVFYGSQVKSRPPTFCLFTNHIKEIRDSYSRYMENQFRFHFGFGGTPLTIQWKGRKESGRKK